MTEDENPSVDLLVGRTIGERYEVRRRIARGGIGAVYEAVHVELGRTVAVKVLAAAYADDDGAIRRFQREARAASRLDHPNIVQTLDLGRLDSGEPYLVMELLEGEDLAEHIARRAPMKPREVLEILRPIASALDAVHAEGILHRDVKPANVFMAKRLDDGVVPKLLDFGLAALRETPEHERLTSQGVVVGTPHYVSPEAAEGLTLDERTDVYSLGLVAFEMLTGVLPIDGDDPLALLYAKVRRPAPTMSQRTGRSFAPALDALVARTLSRTPERRPVSAGELVALFREVVDSLPRDGASPELPMMPTPELRSAREAKVERPAPIDRRGLWVVLAGLLAAVAIIVGTRSVFQGSEAPPLAPREAPRAAQPVRADTVGTPDVGAPSEAPMQPIAPPPAPERAIRRSEPPRALPPRSEPPEAPRSEAPEAPARPEAPPEAPPAITVLHDEGLSEALAREGGAELLRGRFPRARQLYRQASFADPENARAWRGLGLTSERMGLAPEAISAYRSYLRLAPTASDSDQIRERLAHLERAALQ